MSDDDMPDFMKAAHRSYAHMMAINSTIEETVGILPFKAEAAAALGKELANQLNQMKKQGLIHARFLTKMQIWL